MFWQKQITFGWLYVGWSFDSHSYEWMNEWKVYYLKLKETFINDNRGKCGKSANGYQFNLGGSPNV